MTDTPDTPAPPDGGADEVDESAPRVRGWSGTRKVGAVGGVLVVLGIVALAVAGALLSREYRLVAATGGGRLVVATTARAARGDLVAFGGRAERVLGVAGDRVSGPPLTVDGHRIDLSVPPVPATTVPPGAVYLAGTGVRPPGDVVVATLRGGEFTAVPATTAFTGAGLPGPATTDGALVRLLVLGVAGGAVVLLGVLVLAAAALAAVTSRLGARMDALAEAE